MRYLHSFIICDIANINSLLSILTINPKSDTKDTQLFINELQKKKDFGNARLSEIEASNKLLKCEFKSLGPLETAPIDSELFNFLELLKRRNYLGSEAVQKLVLSCQVFYFRKFHCFR